MNILELANPAGLWWAAVAVPIVLLYVLKVRLRRQPVSTFLFWDQVFHEKKPRSWWQHLRHVLSLLLQVLLLALLVFALMDPLWDWQKAQRRKVLLVIDNSASMAAEDGGQTRLHKAKETAAALVRSLRVGDEMAILAAGGRPEVTIGLTDHARSLLDAVDKVGQTDAPSALTDAVLAAKRLLAGDTHSTIYVLTDGCDAATEDLSKDGSIQLIGYGAARDNQAITQFQVRRSLLDAIGYQTLIEVSNFGAQTYKGRLELSLEEQLVDVVPVELESGASQTLHLDHASATGGRLVARLDTSDALATDNLAMAVLPTRHAIEVSVITPGSLFLKSALESIPLVDLKLFVQELPETTDGTTQFPDNFVLPESAQRPITILHRLVPRQLPAGKLLIINPQTDCELWSVGKAIEQPIVATVSEQSPVTQHVKLANVLFPDARVLTFNTTADSLIKTPLDEPLLIHLKRSSGDVLVLNVNLDEGDLPLRIAFPVLMKNALEWFDGSSAELQQAISSGASAQVLLPKPITKSETVSIEKTEDAKQPELGVLHQSQVANMSKNIGEANQSETNQYWVRDPAGNVSPLSSDAEMATLSVMKLAGLWSIGTKVDLENDPWFSTKESKSDGNVGEVTKPEQTESVRHLACNLSNREESDLRPRIKLEMDHELGLLSLGGSSIWFYCVLMAVALTAVEWWLYQRRIVG